MYNRSARVLYSNKYLAQETLNKFQINLNNFYLSQYESNSSFLYQVLIIINYCKDQLSSI